MNLSSPAKIVQYFCSEVEKELDEIVTGEYRGHFMEQNIENCRLTFEESELIKDQMPTELLFPFQPIRGNPSPISPLLLPRYCYCSYGVAKFLLRRRYPNLFTNSTYDPVTLHDFKTNPSKRFVLSNDKPITSLILFGMIQQMLQQYGHGFIGESYKAEVFRKLVREYLFNSLYWTSDNHEDHHSLYALFLEATYWHDYADMAGTFGDEPRAFSLLCEISEIFYNPKHPQHNGIGARLDALDMNWRVNTELDGHWHNDATDKSLPNLISIIEKSLASP